MSGWRDADPIHDRKLREAFERFQWAENDQYGASPGFEADAGAWRGDDADAVKKFAHKARHGIGRGARHA